MSLLKRAREKVDLIILCDDLGLIVPQNSKIADLIKLVKKSECYDEDFAKDRLEGISAEKRNIAERLRKEEEKLQAEKESFKRKENLN